MEKLNSYQIVKTQLIDLDRICDLYNEAILFQKSNNYPHYSYDDRPNHKKSIIASSHYKILFDNEIIGTFNLQPTDEVKWRHLEKGTSIYLLGVVIDSRHKGKGIFKQIMSFVVQYCKNNNLSEIRMDTWADNPPLENHYKKHDFKFVEHYQIPDTCDVGLNCRGDKVVLFEYIISN